MCIEPEILQYEKHVYISKEFLNNIIRSFALYNQHKTFL